MLITEFSSARSCMTLFNQIKCLWVQWHWKLKIMFKVICNIGCAAAHYKSTWILSFVIDIYKSMYKELQQK